MTEGRSEEEKARNVSDGEFARFELVRGVQISGMSEKELRAISRS